MAILSAALCFTNAFCAEPSQPPSSAWSLSYVPLVVTENEPVVLIAKREFGDASPSFMLTTLSTKPPVPTLSVENRATGEAVLRFVPPGADTYVVTGANSSLASVKVTTSFQDLTNAKPVLHHLVNADGSFPILLHSRRLVRETRDWYVVRKFLESVLPDELPPSTLAIIPRISQSLGFSTLTKSLSSQKLPALTTLEIPYDGISPLLTFICGLSGQVSQLTPAQRSLILLLPPGEWNGGLPPDDYRRAVEWLLDRFISAGAVRMLVVGPIGYGVAPARATEYRSAASAASASRMAAYLDTAAHVQQDDLRASPSGPLTDMPNENVQLRLAAVIAEALRKSPVVPPGEGN